MQNPGDGTWIKFPAGDSTVDTSEIEAVLDEVETRICAVAPQTERVRVLLNSPNAQKKGAGLFNA